MDEKKTCLYDNHVNHFAKMTEFGGFIMPLEYEGIAKEHLAVRNSVGMFDISHMGEIFVQGADTLDYLNHLLTNDFKEASNMTMIYGIMLYPNGTVVDDLMVYKYSNDKCLVVVNASNIDKDYEYMVNAKGDFDVSIVNASSSYAGLAIQGPLAKEHLQVFTKDNLDEMKLFEFKDIKLFDKEFICSRSGYTGSDGFEVYGRNDDIVDLFEKLYEKGVALCGLGARDTLRFEASMPLYGHEISDTITPLEAGLSYAIKLDKDFIGSDALRKQKADGIKRKIVGLELLERGIARNGYKVYKDETEVGYITTGYMIPNTTNCYALALVDSKLKIDDIVNVDIRGRMVKYKIRNKKFLTKGYVR